MDNIKPTPKTQQEIANSLITPYNNPGFVGTDPNDANVSNSARSNQISFKGDTTKPFTIGIIDIDESIIYYFNNIIKPSIIQNGTRIEIPVVYANPERWVASQKEGFLRDKNGKVMCPLITFKRDSIEKNRPLSNKLDANYPYNYATFTKTYSPRNAYDNFDALNNRKPEKTHYAIVIPDYVTLTYSCTIFTYYVEQMNKVIEAINYASDSYWGDPQRFKFNAAIDSFNTVVELNPSEDRIVKSTFNIKMNGYLIPDSYNKETQSVKQFLDKTQVIIEEKIVNNIK